MNPIFFKNTLALSIVSLSICLISCKKFLNETPISQASVGDFFTTVDDYDQAAIALYNGASNVLFRGRLNVMTDLRSDNGTLQIIGAGDRAEFVEIDQFKVSAGNVTVTDMWKMSYILIQRANNILDNIQNSQFGSRLDQYEGEAKFMRAWSYFNLVRFFGGVPLILKNQTADLNATYDISRASVSEVYTQVIEDLTDAKNLLPPSYSSDQSGRINKGAVQALLGTVYMTTKDFSSAITEFKDVMNSSANYGLLDSYEDLFKAGMQGNKEVIWQIQYKSGEGGFGSDFPNFYAPVGSLGILNETGISSGYCIPSDDLDSDYEPGDIRKDITISEGYINNGEFLDRRYIKIYVNRETGDGSNDSGADWYVLRFANVLLMCAEAINEVEQGPTTEAYDYLNQVRNRANLADLSGLDYNSFKEAVYHEERVEYPFEGHKWFDLLRTEKALSVMNSKVAVGNNSSIGISEPITESQLLYPIPNIETEITGLD